MCLNRFNIYIIFYVNCKYFSQNFHTLNYLIQQENSKNSTGPSGVPTNPLGPIFRGIAPPTEGLSKAM